MKFIREVATPSGPRLRRGRQSEPYFEVRLPTSSDAVTEAGYLRLRCRFCPSRIPNICANCSAVTTLIVSLS